MDDRRDPKCLIGMQILKTEKRITLDQEKYTQNILEQINVQDCKSSKTPAENSLILEVAQEDSVRIESNEFRTLVGSLNYLAKQTKPDIIFMTNVLSQFTNGRTVELFQCWQAGVEILTTR